MRRHTLASSTRRWPTLYRLLAAGALTADSPIGIDTVVTALARQPAQVPSGRSGLSQDHRRWQFEVDSGPPKEVLAGIENATGLRIEFATGELGEIHSLGASGLHTWQSALERALVGMQARFALLPDEAVRIELRPVSQRIDVAARPAPSSPAHTAPLRETPQTFSISG